MPPIDSGHYKFEVVGEVPSQRFSLVEERQTINQPVRTNYVDSKGKGNVVVQDAKTCILKLMRKPSGPSSCSLNASPVTTICETKDDGKYENPRRTRESARRCVNGARLNDLVTANGRAELLVAISRVIYSLSKTNQECRKSESSRIG